MPKKNDPSNEQKKYVASVCPEFHPGYDAFVNISDDGDATCDICIHWNDGECVIFDDVLTGIDQT